MNIALAMGSVKSFRCIYYNELHFGRVPIMKKSKHPLIKGTLLLTTAGLISRIIGFFYKIFLVSLIGAEGIGIYQMVFPTYILCVSLASSGIQTAISRYTAEKFSTGHIREARNLFLTGMVMALMIASTLSLALFLLAPLLSLYFLKEPRTLSLLRLMALSIPFEALHTCANGYFLGQKKTSFPALSQLFEQSIRVGATLLLYQIMVQNRMAPSPELAVAGLLIAEIAAAFVTVTVLAFQKSPVNLYTTFSHYKKRNSPEAPSSLQTTLKNHVRAILNVALPITSNRLMLNILQSLEAVMIPIRLQLYYGNSSTALSVYGIFSGMAMPLIMFPCAITGSFSMVLLPSVSEANALKNDKKIAATIHSSMLLCFFLGITCTTAFLLFGPSAGILLYENEQVGAYLLTLAWLCPFLYLTTTNSSILHGLGKTIQVFYQNLTGLLVRLLFSWFFIPHFGILGCLWGLLLSQLITALLSVFTLKRSVSFVLQPGSLILLPCICCAIATGILRFLQYLLPFLQNTKQWIPFLLSCGIWGMTVLALYGPAVKILSQNKTTL